jgi:hypothetical protein
MTTAITRKQFVQRSITAAIVVASGCSSDDANDEGAGESGDADCSSGATGNISANHGHSASVPAADITAGAAKDYDITGTASHSHTISLDAMDMANLAGGASVMVTSTAGGTDGHTHDVTLLC